MTDTLPGLFISLTRGLLFKEGPALLFLIIAIMLLLDVMQRLTLNMITSCAWLQPVGTCCNRLRPVEIATRPAFVSARKQVTLPLPQLGVPRGTLGACISGVFTHARILQFTRWHVLLVPVYEAFIQHVVFGQNLLNGRVESFFEAANPLLVEILGFARSRTAAWQGGLDKAGTEGHIYPRVTTAVQTGQQ